MKKVIALALAVLMLATVAFAAAKADVAPGKTITIDRDDGVDGIGANATVIVTTSAGDQIGDVDGSTRAEIKEYIPRSINSTNYSVTNVKFKVGKGLVESVGISDSDECVEVKMADDLDNTKTKDFEVSFKLKGKAKYTLKDSDERDSYLASKYGDNATEDVEVLEKVTLPTLDFNIIGTVGYGLVEITIGNDGDEEIEGLDLMYNKDIGDASVDDILSKNIFKFSRKADGTSGTANEKVPMAGSYTADAMLTQEYGDALTMEARVYDGDMLFFGIKYTPEKAIVNRLADSDGDLDFYKFNKNKEYTTFNSNVKLYFNDADEDCFVYRINDNNYLVPAGEYSDEDGCWVVKTRTLGQYVVSDVELHDNVVADGDPSTTNPDTGANDVVGIATALAAVALVSAAAISLKK